MNKIKNIALFTGLIVALGFADGMDKADAQPHTYVLHATHKIKSFEVDVPSRNASVHIYNESYELPQHYVSACKASYADKRYGVHIYVTVVNCGAGATTRLLVSYRSTARPNTVEAVISTHP